MNITRLGTAGIAVVAAVMSYGHQVTLLKSADLGLYAYAVPVTVDLLAIIAVAVRHDPLSELAARRAAMWVLLLAGTASVGANVAVGTNLVQRIVGVWTVAVYLLGEWFAARQKRPVEPTVAPEIVAKRRASAAKAAATRKRNAAKKVRTPKAPADSSEAARMLAVAGVAPVSPA